MKITVERLKSFSWSKNSSGLNFIHENKANEDFPAPLVCRDSLWDKINF